MFDSASKVILLLFGVTACVAYLFAVMTGVITPEGKDFMILASGVFGFFFGMKSDPSLPLGGK